MFLRNAAKTTTLGGELNNPTTFNFTERTNPPQEEGFYVFEPFYSYPRSWDIIHSDALAFYIELTWSDGTTYEPCYYKVLPNTSQLDPNNWYHMDLTIGVMGTTTQEEEPVSVSNVTYKVVDWANGNDLRFRLMMDMIVFAITTPMTIRLTIFTQPSISDPTHPTS